MGSRNPSMLCDLTALCAVLARVPWTRDLFQIGESLDEAIRWNA
jgi:hypothetical protein